MALEIRAVTQNFVAEVGDIDLSKKLSAEDESAVKQAFWKYSVLIFPDQELTPQQHIEFAKLFGPIETDRVLDEKVTPQRLDRSFADISNLTPDGKIWSEEDRKSTRLNSSHG